MGAAVIKAVELFAELGLQSLKVAKALATVTDSMVNAANSLSHIPVVGNFLAESLGAAAESAERLYGEFTSLSSIGVTFSGSMTAMVNAASSAGLTIEQFNGILKNSGPMLAALAGSTDEGAKRFSQISKVMKEGGLTSELHKLGYTTEQVNGGMASYMKSISSSGKLSTMSTAQLASGSAKYLKEIDLLARVTGESRETKEKEMEVLAKNVQFQAAIAHLAPEQQSQMRSFIALFPESAREYVQDMVASGNITNEGGVLFNAMLSETSAALRGLKSSLDSGTVSTSQLASVNDLFINEAKANYKNYKDLFIQSSEFKDVGSILVQAQQMQTGALYKSIEAQKKSNAEAEDVEKIAKFKEQIAETGNKFTLALMNMGALETLQSAFTGLANFTSTYLMPIINGMYTGMGMIKDGIVALTPLWDGLVAVLSPFADLLKIQFDSLLNFLGGSDGLSHIMNFIGDILKVFGKLLSILFTPLKILMRAADGVSSTFMTFLKPTFDKFGEGMSFLVSAMANFDDAVADLIDGIFSYLPPMMGGISKAEAARRSAERAAAAKKRKDDEQANKDAAAKKSADEKNTLATKESTKATKDEADAKNKLNAANKASLDFSSPESLYNSMQKLNNPDQSNTGTSNTGTSNTGEPYTGGSANAPADIQQYMKQVGFVESQGNPNAKNDKSTARGLFQFLEKTWRETTAAMGKKYSLQDRFDPKKASEVMAFYTKSQKAQLEKSMGRSASNLDLYMAHFLGASGAASFLKAKDQNPNQSAAARDREKAKANPNIYYDNGRERSVAEVYALMGKKMDNAANVLNSGKFNTPGIQLLNTLFGGTAQQSNIVTPKSAAGSGRGFVNPFIDGNGVVIPPTNTPAPTDETTTQPNETVVMLNTKLDTLIGATMSLLNINADQLRVQQDLSYGGLLVK